MTQVAREEDEREDGDADERVRRDFGQDVAGENPHARPVKARIAWEACAKWRSLSEVVTSRGSDRVGRKASPQRAQRITGGLQTYSAWLCLRGTAEGGRLHISGGALGGFEE